METEKQIWAKHAWLFDGPAENALFKIQNGLIEGVDVGVSPGSAEVLDGLVVPGMPNTHSHVFQRAMAGLTEVADKKGRSSFWTWRDTMYRFVERLDPENLYHIAAWTYAEMLKAGYTSVAEFHYLHHQANGHMYDDRAAMANAVLAASEQAGIHCLICPVFYERSNFGMEDAEPAQRPFTNTTRGFEQLLAKLKTDTYGVALHSLRAVEAKHIKPVAAMSKGPVHIHIAEQDREVDDCLAVHDMRPVEFLASKAALSQKWVLVHATHVTEKECGLMAKKEVTVSLCPTTEANLGDGLFPLQSYLKAGGVFAIGSDSHISVDPREELRLLEYGQRLKYERRAVLHSQGQPHVGAWLYTHAAANGSTAVGGGSGVLAKGKRADMVHLDLSHPALAARDMETVLDSHVFVGGPNAVRDVFVAGRQVVKDGQVPGEINLKTKFNKVLQKILKG